MRIAVVGAGTGGSTFAGTVARLTGHEVVLLEAGPDYGPFGDLGWPAEIMDSRRIPQTHDWGLLNEDPRSGRRFELPRARILGGCSAHNGCSAVRGLRSDFEAWQAAGGDFWSPDAFVADLEAVETALRVRRYAQDEITPYQQDVHAAALAAGFPVSQDINDIDEGIGASICPVNKIGGVRWNAAYAFVDPVRAQQNFAIIDHFEVRELLFSSDRVSGVRGMRRGQALDIDADLVVLAAGAYGSPIILMRSGIGDAATLKSAGIAVRHELPGVGRNLQDHPCLILDFEATAQLIRRMQEFESRSLAFDEGIIVKARSPLAETPVDIHIFSCGGRRFEPAGWYWQLWVGLMTARSRGQVRPLRDGANLRFAIEHDHLSDAAGLDARTLTWGVDMARRIATSDPLAGMLEREVAPGRAVAGDALAEWAHQNHVCYFHPAGSCAIGRNPAEGAVVDGMCRLHGLQGVMIADASVMPRITATNTNIPTAGLAYRLARHIDEIRRS
ncbi:MAG: GMC family oxidoreductase [Parvibaculaceae bacterium]